MFNTGLLSERDKQRKYVIESYAGGAPCPVCGKIQTPWEAVGTDALTWVDAPQSNHKYHCIECGIEIRHDLYFIGGWGWGNPAVVAHR